MRDFSIYIISDTDRIACSTSVKHTMQNKVSEFRNVTRTPGGRKGAAALLRWGKEDTHVTHVRGGRVIER